MASDVNDHAPLYLPSLLLGIWDNTSSPRALLGALASKAADTSPPSILVVEAALHRYTTMASGVNNHAPPYLLSLLLGILDNTSSPQVLPGALASTAADTSSCLQRSTQQKSTWELVLFYILLFPLFLYLDIDTVSFSSSIPVTHLMSDGPSCFIPRHEFTTSGCLEPHAIYPLSVRMFCKSQVVFSGKSVLLLDLLAAG